MAILAITMPIRVITMAISAITIPIRAITMRRSGRSRSADLRDHDGAIFALKLSRVIMHLPSITCSDSPDE